MHTYDVDSEERKNVVIALVPLAIGVAALIHAATLPLDWGGWWLIDLPTPFAAFGLLYLWVERWGWRSHWFRQALRIKTPILGGTWSGSLWSSHDKELRDFSLYVKQTWTKISVTSRSVYSSSASKTASILTGEGPTPMLLYTYLNTPRSDAVETMHMHHGTGTHYYDKAANTLDGDFYTGRDRQTHGTMTLRRQRTQ